MIILHHREDQTSGWTHGEDRPLANRLNLRHGESTREVTPEVVGVGGQSAILQIHQDLDPDHLQALQEAVDLTVGPQAVQVAQGHRSLAHPVWIARIGTNLPRETSQEVLCQLEVVAATTTAMTLATGETSGTSMALVT